MSALLVADQLIPMTVPNKIVAGDFLLPVPMTVNFSASGDNDEFPHWVCHCGNRRFELRPEGAWCPRCRDWVRGWA